MQTTNHILMIRPVNFKYNEQTADNNKFQQASSEGNIQALALKEFDGFVKILQQSGVDVTVIEDKIEPATPDSIFPNNWVSFHDNGEIILYPMFSENRRAERRPEILDVVADEFAISKITDLSNYETEDIFLEGTGSLVLDRENKIAYACLSLRTNEKVINDFCEKAGYSAIVFTAVDSSGFPIYHTNVMMCIGDKFAVICLESIPTIEERRQVTQSLTNSGKEIIEIFFPQMNHFAGNMLQVQNNLGESLLIMSEQAKESLTAIQLETIEKYAKIIDAPLYTIEKNGGGSARCMLAEIHLPTKG